MNIVIRLLSTFAIQASALVAVSSTTMAQEVPTTPQQRIMQRICSFDAVENLLPPPSTQQSNSRLSYLQKQGFRQDSDGSWVCYVSDPNEEWHYHTLFRVKEKDGKLVATSFLKNGSLMEGQENRSLDLFMTLIEHHTNTKQGNRQSIRRYLEAFIALVKQGKVSLSHHGYLFDQPNNGFVLYHQIKGTKLKGTAITISLNMSRTDGSIPVLQKDDQ